MRRITVDNIMEREPCDEYPRKRVEALWGGRESLTLTEILNLNIPAKDRVWAVIRFLSKEENGQFARWCALQVTHLWDCPDVVKQYLETGGEGLRDAARSAALDAAHTTAYTPAHIAASDAARSAARSAAWDAAWYAAWAALNAAWDAWDAARDDEHQKQVEKLKGVVK